VLPSSSKVSAIKKAQKESLLLREISTLYFQASADDTRLQNVTITKVELADNKGTCKVFFYTPEGETSFSELLEIIKLYKPSLRKALASRLNGRYTPDIVFVFDQQQAKQIRVETLIEQIKGEGQSS
jgi:ribosome-binding factor A